MPTYEYRCSYCHELTEAFQRMSDAPLTECPHCGKPGLTRLVSGGAGVIYKGEGWYVTDYSKKSSGGKETPASEVKEKVAKSEANESQSPAASPDPKAAPAVQSSPAPKSPDPKP